MTYHFAGFRLDVDQQRLEGPNGTFELPETLFRILLLLLQARGATVTREALVAGVWNNGFVADATITQHVFRLRKLLRDGSGGPGYIVTEPGRGYRLDADVSIETA